MPDTWDYGVVALLDVLGFSALVEADAASSKPTNLDRLVVCLQKARASTPAGKLDVRSFSDSIVVSSPLNAPAVVDVVLAVAGLQRIFVGSGVLIRGAIALGKHYADKDSMYSEALVRAYRLERDDARVPRVVLDRQLLDWFLNEISATDDLKRALRTHSLRDRDGQIFVHYLNPATIGEHRTLLTSYDPAKQPPRVLEKLQWLAAYHNFVARDLGHEAALAGPLVDGFQAL